MKLMTEVGLPEAKGIGLNLVKLMAETGLPETKCMRETNKS
jgi:hypothetical protein